MNLPKERRAWVIVWVVFALLCVLSGLVFYFVAVGEQSTNPLSIIFGWQWLYMAAASIAVLAAGIWKKHKPLRKAALTVIAALLLVLIPAQFVYSQRLYITTVGGPAGPDMNCLVWNKSDISGAYGDHFLSVCTFMSIPSFNKFLIDQRWLSDMSDSSATYYAMFILNEAILIGGTVLAVRKLKT